MERKKGGGLFHHIFVLVLGSCLFTLKTYYQGEVMRLGVEGVLDGMHCYASSGCIVMAQACVHIGKTMSIVGVLVGPTACPGWW